MSALLQTWPVRGSA